MNGLQMKPLHNEQRKTSYSSSLHICQSFFLTLQQQQALLALHNNTWKYIQVHTVLHKLFIIIFQE